MTGIPIISTRAREVWTHVQKRRLDRLAQDLHTAQVRLLLECKAPCCPDRVIRLVEDDRTPDGRVLQCGCTTRHFQPRLSH